MKLKFTWSPVRRLTGLCLLICTLSFHAVGQSISNLQFSSGKLITSTATAVVGIPYAQTLEDGNYQFNISNIQSTSSVINDVNDKDPVFKMQLYPTLTTDMVFVSMENVAEPVRMQIHDTSGKLHLEQMNYTDQVGINVNTLAQGAYFLSVLMKDQKQQTFKFIKQ